MASPKACHKRIVQTETGQQCDSVCKNLLYAVALVVSEQLGKIRKGKVRQNQRRKSDTGKEG